VSSSIANEDEGDTNKKKIEMREKIRSRRETRNRGKEDSDPRSQRGQQVRPAALISQQVGEGLEVGLTLIKG
jgi:hypothetical protein